MTHFDYEEEAASICKVRKFKVHCYLMRPLSSVGIVGGGLSGLSCAFHIKKLLPETHLVVYDYVTNTPTSRSMDENTASVAAAGLLHPFSPSGTLIWRGLECFEETLSLVHLVEKTTGKKLYDRDIKIIRPALEERDTFKLEKTASQYSKLCSYYDKDEGLLRYGSSVFIPAWRGVAQYESSLVLDPVSYLSSLWSTIVTLFDEVEWKNQKIDIQEVDKIKEIHDAVVFAGEYETNFSYIFVSLGRMASYNLLKYHDFRWCRNPRFLSLA